MSESEGFGPCPICHVDHDNTRREFPYDRFKDPAGETICGACGFTCRSQEWDKAVERRAAATTSPGFLHTACAACDAASIAGVADGRPVWLCQGCSRVLANRIVLAPRSFPQPAPVPNASRPVWEIVVARMSADLDALAMRAAEKMIADEKDRARDERVRERDHDAMVDEAHEQRAEMERRSEHDPERNSADDRVDAIEIE